jgi:hypothetical protein
MPDYFTSSCLRYCRKAHRRLIKKHMRAIRIRRERDENLHTRGTGHYHMIRGHSLEALEDDLLDIGESMITDQVWSDSLNASTSSSTNTSTNSAEVPMQSSSDTSFDRSRLLSNGYPDNEVRSSKNSANIRSRLNLPQYLPSTSQLSSPVSRKYSSLPAIRPESLQQSVPGQQNEILPRTPMPLEDHREDGDYIAVQPLNNLFVLEPNPQMEVLQGCLDDKDATAFFIPEFPQNVISRACVQHFGLEIENHDEESPVIEVDFGDGWREIIRGEVTFTWKKSPSSPLRPLTVTCFVCDVSRHHLIFGQRFIRKQRHYWQLDSSRNHSVCL